MRKFIRNRDVTDAGLIENRKGIIFHGGGKERK